MLSKMGEDKGQGIKEKRGASALGTSTCFDVKRILKLSHASCCCNNTIWYRYTNASSFLLEA